jgi:hypothetical protein
MVEADGFVVELEPGVWLVRPDVDPERTLVIENATRYLTERSAGRQLSKVRKLTWGKFPGAEIYEPQRGKQEKPND